MLVLAVSIQAELSSFKSVQMCVCMCVLLLLFYFFFNFAIAEIQQDKFESFLIERELRSYISITLSLFLFLVVHFKSKQTLKIDFINYNNNNRFKTSHFD